MNIHCYIVCLMSLYGYTCTYTYCSSNDTVSARIECNVSSSDEMHMNMLLAQVTNITVDLRMHLGYVENFNCSGIIYTCPFVNLYNLSKLNCILAYNYCLMDSCEYPTLTVLLFHNYCAACLIIVSYIP